MTHFSSKFLFFLLFLTSYLFTNADPLDPNRIYVDSSLAPFYHGVASGDPTSNSVFIWSRITTDELSPTISWRIATDTGMNNIIQSGTISTNSDKDYTIKVAVNNLQPNTYYFYEFTYNNQHSLRGRTKTLPTGNVDKIRFAVVSCSSFPHGYFNVYQAINQRNDVDAIIHLGDYIYEYGKNEYGTVRVPSPENEILTLSDYRLRHSMYKLDSMLMRLHQQFPFYTIWDDHEFADNAFVSGAENHTTGTEGNWQIRKMSALKAYNEWMPINNIDSVPAIKLYRKINIGNLVDLIFVDTRITARTEQSLLTSISGIDDTTHYLIGNEQFNWLKNQIINSTAQWKVMVNQVMVAPFKVFNAAFNSDQWDGYPSERKKLFKIINDYSIKNFVVLTGDIHSAWANDLPFGTVGYNAGTHKGSVGVEFVTTAVTSPGIPLTGILGNITQDAFAQLIRDNNAHVKHNNMVKRGFNIIDFTKEKCQSDFYNIETIETPNKNYTYQVSYLTEKDSNYLKMSTTQTTTTQINPIKAPLQVRQNIISSVKNKTNNIEITGVYPNPFINYTGIQYAVSTSSAIYVYVYNNAGQLVFYKDLGIKNKGVYFEKFDLGDLPNGNYILNLFNGIDLISRKISKSE